MNKRICAAAVAVIICMTQFLTVWAADRQLPLLVDGADLLTAEEEQELTAVLKSTGVKWRLLP